MFGRVWTVWTIPNISIIYRYLWVLPRPVTLTAKLSWLLGNPCKAFFFENITGRESSTICKQISSLLYVDIYIYIRMYVLKRMISHHGCKIVLQWWLPKEIRTLLASCKTVQGVSHYTGHSEFLGNAIGLLEMSMYGHGPWIIWWWFWRLEDLLILLRSGICPRQHGDIPIQSFQKP